MFAAKLLAKSLDLISCRLFKNSFFPFSYRALDDLGNARDMPGNIGKRIFDQPVDFGIGNKTFDILDDRDGMDDVPHRSRFNDQYSHSLQIRTEVLLQVRLSKSLL